MDYKTMQVSRKIFSLFVFMILSFASNAVWSGGSLAYEDIKAALGEDKIVFETLEMAIDFESGALADIRIMSGINENMAGHRLGPYYICGRQKYGDQKKIGLIFNTEAAFIDNNGESSDILETDTKEIKEKLLGIKIIPSGSKEYFPFGCLDE